MWQSFKRLLFHCRENLVQMVWMELLVPMEPR